MVWECYTSVRIYGPKNNWPSNSKTLIKSIHESRSPVRVLHEGWRINCYSESCLIQWGSTKLCHKQNKCGVNFSSINVRNIPVHRTHFPLRTTSYSSETTVVLYECKWRSFVTTLLENWMLRKIFWPKQQEEVARDWKNCINRASAFEIITNVITTITARRRSWERHAKAWRRTEIHAEFCGDIWRKNNSKDLDIEDTKILH